jgi:hypothetical protein
VNLRLFEIRVFFFFNAEQLAVFFKIARGVAEAGIGHKKKALFAVQNSAFF